MGNPSSDLRRLARLLKALGHRDRLRIVAILAQREACVCELVEWLGLRQATVSQHLSMLRGVGAVRARRRGTRVFYRLAHPSIPALLEAMGVRANVAQVGSACQEVASAQSETVRRA